jgi:hypothetical protein
MFRVSSVYPDCAVGVGLWLKGRPKGFTVVFLFWQLEYER